VTGDDHLFLDTALVRGLLSRTDQHHEDALRLEPRLPTAAEIWTTEAVLVEIANTMSSTNRLAAARFIEMLYRTRNARIEPVTSELLQRGLTLYRSRPDKQWGLTDCISFVVMADRGITDALTTDQHYVQAGFNALMRSSSP
jgi:uncharacterized protein